MAGLHMLSVNISDRLVFVCQVPWPQCSAWALYYLLIEGLSALQVHAGSVVQGGLIPPVLK